METPKRVTFEKKGTRIKPEPIKASEILNAIAENKNIDVEYAVIEGDLKIDRIANRLKPDEKGSLIIQGDVLIQFSEVKGSARFEKTTFSGDANFMATTFTKSASFKKATFSGKADFSGSTFSRYAYFGEATFSGDVNFWSATFSTCRDSASFEKFANFEKATFSGSASFKKATFSGSVSFREATFEVNADFDETRMKYPANFAGVNYNENTLFVGFWNNIFCPFVRHLTFDRIVLSEKPFTNFLKVNTTTIMDSSSNPYLKRYIDDEQWIASWQSRGKMRRFLFIIWELMCHCGRSIILWAFWSILFAAIFGLIYAPLSCPSWIPIPIQDLLDWADPQIHIDSNTYNHPIWTSIYFSIVTFTTLGFGDVQPKNGAGLFWVGFEVILGYVMLGGLISIFADKLARRS